MIPDAPKYKVGSVVYHRIDDDPGLIRGVVFRVDHIAYEVVWALRAEGVYDSVELSPTKSFVGGAEYRDRDSDDA